MSVIPRRRVPILETPLEKIWKAIRKVKSLDGSIRDDPRIDKRTHSESPGMSRK